VLVPLAAILAPTVIWEWPANWRSSIATFHAWEYVRHFSCLGIGCLTAIFYLTAPRVLLRFLYHPAVQAGVLGCLVVLLWIAHSHGEEGVRAEFGADARWYSLLFGVVILNAATNPNPLIRFENRVADYLGRISYGLYMYHPLAIALAVYALRPLILDSYRGW